MHLYKQNCFLIIIFTCKATSLLFLMKQSTITSNIFLATFTVRNSNTINQSINKIIIPYVIINETGVDLDYMPLLLCQFKVFVVDISHHFAWTLNLVVFELMSDQGCNWHCSECIIYVRTELLTHSSSFTHLSDWFIELCVRQTNNATVQANKKKATDIYILSADIP